MGYPHRTRDRALELYLAPPDASSRSANAIAARLVIEGHGKVSVTAVARWIRQDPGIQASNLRDLGQRISVAALNASPGLRTAATMLEASGEPERITAATAGLADLLSMAVRRAKKALPRMPVGNVNESALVGCIINLNAAALDAGRVMREIRNLSVTSNFRDAANASPAGLPSSKPAMKMPEPDSPFAHLLQPSNFAEAE